MCGIAGFIGADNFNRTELTAAARGMAAAMTHRGPDDEGIWTDFADEITLVHRRLAVIDLSPNGHQPMQSASKRYQLVFNGEIYNHLDLRAQLEGEGMAPTWNGHSDTETLLALIDAWGLKRALQASAGMFALALWDIKEKTLSLARDRMGEKPVYYGEQGGSFVFASELKPLTRHPAFERRIDPDAIAGFMQYLFIPAPMSIYAGIKKLEPGRILACHRKEGRFELEETIYWNLTDAVNAGAANLFTGDRETIVDGLEVLLGKATARQMVADVPIGAFLSGGVDSSLIVALMQAHSARPINTYSIGFDDSSGFFDEAPFAGAVAKHLGTNHSELYVTAQDALNVIPELPRVYDEPFADTSQIPTILLSRLTRRDVTVALSGDGGDELFGGYNRYLNAMKVNQTLGSIPAPVRSMMAMANGIMPWGGLEILSGYSINKILGSGGGRGLAYKMDKLNRGLTAQTSAEFCDIFNSYWINAAELVPGSRARSVGSFHSGLDDDLSFMQQMLAFDMNQYLPDDILVKVDRAAMASSLETRIPMLDHAVVEYALKIPDELKIKQGENKHLLKQLLYRHVPRELVERPKRGFDAPVVSWLKWDLRDWAENLLEPQKIREAGYLNEKIVTQKWSETFSGKRDWLTDLWPVLMFQAWVESEGL